MSLLTGLAGLSPLDASTGIHVQPPQIDKLAAAYVKAWGEMPNAVKNATNPHLGNNYVDLEGMLAVAKPVFARHGLAIYQSPGKLNEAGTRVSVRTILVHESGQSIESVSDLPCVATRYNKKSGETISEVTAQTVGSAITYGKRYAVQSIAGIAPTDDDGNAASAPPADRADPAAEQNLLGEIALLVGAKNKKGLEELKPQIEALGSETVLAAFLDGRAALKKSK
jgi:hypothetical protein